MTSENDEDTTLLVLAARRLDAITPYLPPPTDRSAERLADWFRQGLDMTPSERGGYLAAAAALLNSDYRARQGENEES